MYKNKIIAEKGSSKKSLETSNGFTASDATGSSLVPSDSTQVTTKLAVTSLLHRFREVLVKYVDDEKLSGKCPLPRLVDAAHWPCFIKHSVKISEILAPLTQVKL